MPHYQNFVELNKKGGIVRTTHGGSCFGSRQMLNNSAIQYLEFYPNPRGFDYSDSTESGMLNKSGLLNESNIILTLNEEVEYLQYLQDMGIPFTYTLHDGWKVMDANGKLTTHLPGDNAKNKTLWLSRLAIRIDKDELSGNNTLILSVLNIFRFLSEQPGVVMNFLQLVRDNPKVEKFQLMQLAMLTAVALYRHLVRWDSYPTSGHSLYGRTDISLPKELPTWEEVMDKLRMSSSINTNTLNVNYTFNYNNWNREIVKTVNINNGNGFKEICDLYGITPNVFKSECHVFELDAKTNQVKKVA